MPAGLIAHRIFQAVGLVFILFFVLGGGIGHRQIVPDGVRTTILTLYKSLPPPPKGPAYCPQLDNGDYAVMAPCDFKPPFIGWLEGGKY